MRKLAIWLSWQDFSDYHSRQLAAAISDRYETTVTYEPLDWDEFDVVLCFYPMPHHNPDCARGKIVKCVWEPHEFGYANDAGLVLTASTLVYERVEQVYGDRTVYLPWGINPAHFAPAPFPAGRRRVGWVGTPANPRKQFAQLEAAMSDVPGTDFRANPTHTRRGRLTGAYDLPGIAQFYASIHVYVCGSAYEGWGFPFLEAAACGRPVVSFDVGAARDLLASGAGVVLVETFDEMQEAVMNIDYETLGRQSVQAVEAGWTWEVLAPRWMDVLDRAG